MLRDFWINEDIYQSAFVRTFHLLKANVVLYSSPWPTYYISNIDQHCCHGNSLFFFVFLRAQWRRILSTVTWFSLGLHKDNTTLILTRQSCLCLAFHTVAVYHYRNWKQMGLFSPHCIYSADSCMFANITHHCSCLCHASDFLAKPLNCTLCYPPIFPLICFSVCLVLALRADFDFLRHCPAICCLLTLSPNLPVSPCLIPLKSQVLICGSCWNPPT